MTAKAVAHRARSTCHSHTRKWPASESSGTHGCPPTSSHTCGQHRFLCRDQVAAAATSRRLAWWGTVVAVVAAVVSRGGSSRRSRSGTVRGAEHTYVAQVCAAARRRSRCHSSACGMDLVVAGAAWVERHHTRGVEVVAERAAAMASRAHSNRCSGTQRARRAVSRRSCCPASLGHRMFDL